MNTYIVLDFETGGFNAQENPAIELAALALRGDTFEELGRFNRIIKPYDENHIYDDSAFKIHGISKYEAETSGSSVKEVVKDFSNFCKDHKKGKGKGENNILVGHNLPFDINFMQQIFKYSNIKMSDVLFKGYVDYFGNFSPFFVDTIELCRELWQEDETVKYKLEFCIEKAGLELTDAHRAMNDVLATRDLLVWLIQKIRNNNDTSSVVKKVRARDTILKI